MCFGSALEVMGLGHAVLALCCQAAVLHAEDAEFFVFSLGGDHKAKAGQRSQEDLGA